MALARLCFCLDLLHAYLHALREGRAPLGWLVDYSQSLVSALYVTSRIVMMGEVFAALRAEDPAIYDTYGFSDFWMPLL